MELRIDDPAFALLKLQIDNHLRSTITNMVDRNSDEGAMNCTTMQSPGWHRIPVKKEVRL